MDSLLLTPAPAAAAAPSPAAASRLRHLQPAGLYDATANGYTHVVSVDGPVRWVFVSGQGGENTAAELPDDFAAQAEQALANLALALHAAQADARHVLKLTVLIVEHSMERFEQWQTALRRHWGPGDDGRPSFPACTLVPVPKLALPGMLIEVEATAAVPLRVGP